MAEDDPFADLGATLEDDGDDQEDTVASQEASEHTNPESTPTGTEDSDEEVEGSTDPMTDTAFSYEAAQQRPFYAREDTITEFDAWLNYELERELSIRGYQNIVVREMTDALLRTVVEEDLVDEVAERFEEARKKAISK
ncbi:hypothetical protein [Halogranum rubrum]|nr:hypothetical protein [Halogranum salarium]